MMMYYLNMKKMINITRTTTTTATNFIQQLSLHVLKVIFSGCTLE